MPFRTLKHTVCIQREKTTTGKNTRVCTNWDRDKGLGVGLKRGRESMFWE